VRPGDEAVCYLEGTAVVMVMVMVMGMVMVMMIVMVADARSMHPYYYF
jgi:hypothetical protein